MFRARGLADMDEFDKLCPEPKPPVRLTKAGKEPNEEDANWRSAMLAHGRRRVAYMVVKSLEPSEIEWDTVDLDVLPPGPSRGFFAYSRDCRHCP